MIREGKHEGNLAKTIEIENSFARIQALTLNLLKFGSGHYVLPLISTITCFAQPLILHETSIDVVK